MRGEHTEGIAMSPKKKTKKPSQNRKEPDDRRLGEKDFSPPAGLDGKTDSGPEPDIFGREIPPQKGEDA
jgi:hypothetical protein